MSRFLITGATGGLGNAVCAKLHAIGHEVETLGRADADFSSLQDIANMTMARAGLGGQFSGIVHCAGAELVKPLRLTTDKDYALAMMAATSACGLLRAAASNGVMADGGSIVLISSVAAHRGTPGMAAYSASKAAIEAMARCAAIELAPRHIRVNCIAAGAFESPMHERLMRRQPEAARAAYAAKHPLGIGSVEAVCDAALHLLLSDAARWTTGSTMVIDGGFLTA